MRNLLQVSLLLLTISSLCYAGYNLGKYLPNTVTPTEEDIYSLYEMYLSKVGGQLLISDSPARYQLFRQNVIDTYANNNNPESTYKRAINKFTGLFENELVGRAIMANQDCSATTPSVIPVTSTSFPATVDWRDNGIITPVKDQKDCGSCWAFSTTGALESFWALYTQISPVLLSEQQLIDCAQAYGNNGCQGGLPSMAFEYITGQGGLDTENAYPYESLEDTCRFQEDNIGAKLFSGSVNITQSDEAAILNAVANVGPVSVAFQVTTDFLSYSSGVFTSKICTASPQTVNHAVLVVGYGTDATTGLDYWLVKNSWGTNWGEDGYFQIQRGVNMCGIAECASYPNMAGAPSMGFLGIN